MESGHHQHQQYPFLNVTQEVELAGGERDRLPQWSFVETRELLALRWQLDQSFMETKRNRLLWEVISAQMKEKGFHRTPDQCKCKWKNLVARYKGSESMEAETGSQLPFHDDMRRIFSNRMKRLLSSGETKKGVQHLWCEEEEDEALFDEDPKHSKKKKNGRLVGGSRNKEVMLIKKALRDFMKWQMQMEAKWHQASEAREAERRSTELKWRQAMEALAGQRTVMDRRWREREEERRGREEERAERRHQLIVALLTRLTDSGM